MAAARHLHRRASHISAALFVGSNYCTRLEEKSIGKSFFAVMIGYLANYGIPRSGEVIRCGVLKSSDDVPFSEAFGTVVVERNIDTLCLLLVFLLVLLIEFSELKSLWLQYIWDPQ